VPIHKSAAKLLLFCVKYVLKAQNCVSFWQKVMKNTTFSAFLWFFTISLSLDKFTRCAPYDLGEVSPCRGA
jgi:hypothetical protein